MSKRYFIITGNYVILALSRTKLDYMIEMHQGTKQVRLQNQPSNMFNRTNS